jgi:hypothetical protein
MPTIPILIAVFLSPDGGEVDLQPGHQQKRVMARVIRPSRRAPLLPGKR